MYFNKLGFVKATSPVKFQFASTKPTFASVGLPIGVVEPSVLTIKGTNILAKVSPKVD